MKVLIIGAGASGLVTAIRLKERNIDVTIIEKNNKIGKKLLLTGNGRCNFWNEEQNINKYYASDLDILQKIIDLKINEVLPFFDSLGIKAKVINNYYYPYSNQAISIVNAMARKIEKLGIKIKLEEEVLDIVKKDKFIVTTNKDKYEFDKVVLAMGSKACPKTGSDGLGYTLAKKLGHTINEVLPSLVYLIGEDHYYKKWDGVRSEAILTLIEDGKVIKKEQGEVQFTKLGISGICTFNLSGYIAKGLSLNKKEEVYINLVPWFKEDNFKKFLDEQNKKLKGYTIKEILEGFLNYKLVNLILDLLHIKDEDYWENINQDLLVEYLVNFPFKVKDIGDFANAQICFGGIPLKEVNYENLESKLVKGLYFTGEILDAHGDCGGYNLGLCWISGLIVGDKLND